jgi:hypothetical protein
LSVSEDNFDNYRAEEFFRVNDSIIGTGRCGGKAKGLAYATEAISDSHALGGVGFPDLTIVLSTEIFDEHASRSGVRAPSDEEAWSRAHNAILDTPFSPALEAELWRVLERFDEIGSPPLAVRSSSLLEDSSALAFAGKYETCFSPNIGSMSERRDILERAVRGVFASMFNPEPRAYREKHGILNERESMAVIIQAVAGRRHYNYFYPELAGTLFSRVFRRPNPRIKKEDGLVRLCFGLGTRTVDRCAARTFYLTNPSLRPEGGLPSQIASASQECFDYIDMEHGEFSTGNLTVFAKFLEKEHRNFGAYAQYYGDDYLYSTYAEPEVPTRPIFSFPELHIRERALFDTSKALLKYMEETAGFPVDIEFSYETVPSKKLCVLQMRPLASYQELARVEIPDIPEERVIFRSDRMVSNGLLENVTHMVYVDPALYRDEWNPSGAARAVGEANKILAGKKYILAGPGRWGSRNPMLGVPVRYDEICNCGVLVEISVPDLSFSPELSFGTHFFLDMDADGILYLPVFGRAGGNRYHKDWLDSRRYRTGNHPAVRIYEGDFSAYLDGEEESGIIISNFAP